MRINPLKIVQNTRSVRAFLEEDRSAFPAMSLNWEQDLYFASEPFKISKDPKDYLLHPVPIMYSDLPNRNGVAFPLVELLKWNVELGRQAYRGWIGMPMFREHKSDVVKESIGMVVDVSLRKISKFSHGKFWKVLALAAIDRRKNPVLAERMEKNEINTYSIGAMVDYCTCSYCGVEVGKCNHIDDDENKVTFYEKNGEIVFKNVFGVKPYELSSVEDPAFATAIGGEIMKY